MVTSAGTDHDRTAREAGSRQNIKEQRRPVGIFISHRARRAVWPEQSFFGLLFRSLRARQAGERQDHGDNPE
jgi:hypothetical protein